MAKRPSDPEKRRLMKLDEQFLAWVKMQPSCISGTFSEWHDGVGYSIPCHVRRAANAGTGYKPLFSAAPMTDAEHKLTHQHGEEALRPAEWFEQKASEYYTRWLKENPLARSALIKLGHEGRS